MWTRVIMMMLRLGLTGIGARCEESLKKLLQLKADEIPVYFMPVGSRPSGS